MRELFSLYYKKTVERIEYNMHIGFYTWFGLPINFS